MKKPTREGLIAVVVGTVTNDVRLYKIPKMTVAALHVTEKARARILAAGGEMFVFSANKVINHRNNRNKIVQESPKK